MTDEPKDPPDNVVNLDDYRHDSDDFLPQYALVSLDRLEELEDRVSALEKSVVKNNNRIITLMKGIDCQLKKIMDRLRIWKN